MENKLKIKPQIAAILRTLPEKPGVYLMRDSKGKIVIWDVLFGSMAVTIMAGLTVSTVLTLIFIPVLTAIFYKVEPHD